MNDYVTFKVTEYSGYGIDDKSGWLEYERFANDFKGRLEWTDIAEQTLGDGFHKFTPEKYIASHCTLKKNPNYNERASKYGYSNGIL